MHKVKIGGRVAIIGGTFHGENGIVKTRLMAGARPVYEVKVTTGKYAHVAGTTVIDETDLRPESPDDAEPQAIDPYSKPIGRALRTQRKKPDLMLWPDWINERSNLAALYALDGAYHSAATVLESLAEETKAHAEAVMPTPRTRT